MEGEVGDCIPQDGLLYEQHIGAAGSNFLDHLQNIVSLLLQYPAIVFWVTFSLSFLRTAVLLFSKYCATSVCLHTEDDAHIVRSATVLH